MSRDLLSYDHCVHLKKTNPFGGILSTGCFAFAAAPDLSRHIHVYIRENIVSNPSLCSRTWQKLDGWSSFCGWQCNIKISPPYRTRTRARNRTFYDVVAHTRSYFTNPPASCYGLDDLHSRSETIFCITLYKLYVCIYYYLYTNRS